LTDIVGWAGNASLFPFKIMENTFRLFDFSLSRTFFSKELESDNKG